MAEYNPKEIESKWQQRWQELKTYKVEINHDKPKYYVLDMFPYPSGAGLHVGHPLGYIATDIYSRYKRLNGFNVLHPMGFDAFGLPAEQYAIETGQHPADSTDKNIETYKKQLSILGFSYDWDREFRTCDPDYYKWTQWVFMQLFNAWYNNDKAKAEHIDTLIAEFEKNGNSQVNAACDEDIPSFTANEWKAFSAKEQSDILLGYRLTYLSEMMVNWCPALGTVLANDEVKDGFSERGGHPVERKKMPQWMMRITAYADRLLKNLDDLDWSDSLKEMQRNWIGKSFGCELDFKVADRDVTLTAFTTRPDTTFGVTYVTLAPEHELALELTTSDQKAEVEAYITKAKNRSERERMADVKNVSGVFTGNYVINPFTNEKVQLWVADYVLAGYGTGVVMGVPSSDDRDYRFANHFDLPIVMVIEGAEELEDPTEKKHGKIINSGFMNGMDSKDAIHAAIDKAVELGVGKSKVNFKMRDAAFGRQRYWGEPIPVYYDEQNIPRLIDESDLPLELPAVDKYLPTETGEPPLGRATDWKYKGKYQYELTTMPGWAGSSAYFLRYMDSKNEHGLVSKEAVEYWEQVDLYIGGTEHATGHLFYSRFWNLFLYDMGYITKEEPFKKLVNQGMIQGISQIAYRYSGKHPGIPKVLDFKTPSAELKFSEARMVYLTANYQAGKPFLEENCQEIHVHIKDVTEEGKFGVLETANHKDSTESVYVCNNGYWMDGTWYPNDGYEGEPEPFRTKSRVEKMSKRWYNVVNPDDVVAKYGADTMRLYEMFLGPLEDSKPWSTEGITGVAKFLRKLWKLFYQTKNNEFFVCNTEPPKESLKTLHKTIKKVTEDIERLSFNTCVSAFMECVNELTSQKCYKEVVLKDLVILIAPFAPHIAEELWSKMGYEGSVLDQEYPVYNEEYLKESTVEYPISVNGKVRAKIEFGADMSKEDIEKQVLASEAIQKWLDGKQPKKVIVVPKRIVNVVV